MCVATDIDRQLALMVSKELLRIAIARLEGIGEIKAALLAAEAHMIVNKLARELEAREGNNRRKTDQ